MSQMSRLSESELVRIREMEAEHEAQAAAGDFDAMLPSFAEDVVAMAPNQPDIVGRAALREWQNQFPPMDAYELRVTEIEGCGDLAYVRGVYAMTYTLSAAGEVLSDSGRGCTFCESSRLAAG